MISTAVIVIVFCIIAVLFALLVIYVISEEQNITIDFDKVHKSERCKNCPANLNKSEEENDA